MENNNAPSSAKLTVQAIGRNKAIHLLQREDRQIAVMMMAMA